jgi:pyruvate,water dikinase
MKQDSRYIRWYEEIKIADILIEGGKNASLREMYRELTSWEVNITNGFVVTAEAYWQSSKMCRQGNKCLLFNHPPI